MIKKIIAFAATALCSLSASAGYIQYDLNTGGLQGFIVQHDTDKSIAYFKLQLNDPVGGYGQQFEPFYGDGAVLLTSASTSFLGRGPTSFTITDDYGADHLTMLSVTFSPSARGLFAYTASYTANLYVDQPPRYLSGTVSGVVSTGIVDPILAEELDLLGGYAYGVPRIVPRFVDPNTNEVPEPASIALLALGAAGLVGASRRRNAAR